MKFIVIKPSNTDINFKNLSSDPFGEEVLQEFIKRLKLHYDGNPRGIRGLTKNGSALEYANCGGVCYWIFENVDKNALDSIIEEGESFIFAEISLSEQKSKKFWRRNFSINIENIEFTEINRVVEQSKLCTW